MPLPRVPMVPRPLPVCPPTPVYPLLELVEPLVPLVFVPRPAVGVAAALLLSSSSAFLCTSSLRLCSSCTLLSASCCRRASSPSISSRSCVAPCQLGFRMSRWLCSVWPNILVQVPSSALAPSTVRCTVPILAFAVSKLAVTPSMTRFTSRTRSSSARRRASRVSDWLRARCCC